MPFTPPVFDLFRVNTVNLDVMLSRQFGRYIIVAEEKPSEASSSQAIAVPQSSLEVLLARTHHKVVVGTTDRTTQQAVFKQLSNELREILKENNESKNKKATMFLLGALLHRYFRLIKEYDNYNYLFTIYDVRNCDLFKAIRAALHLPAEMPDGFKANDLAVLDVVTIVDSLTVFRDNMLLCDESKTPRYKKYKHFAADKNFVTYLQDIIDEHTRKGTAVLRQFKAVSFIQSLSSKMQEEHLLMVDELDRWCKELAKQHRDFRKLNISLIEEHMRTHIKSEELQEKIADLLYMPFIKSKVDPDYVFFLTELIKCHKEIGKSEEEHAQMVDLLKRWCKDLEQTTPDFKQLDLKSIESHMRVFVRSGEMADKISGLLNSSYMKSKIEPMDHPLFLSEMKHCHSNVASYTLFGGYSLLLQSQLIDEKLRFCIFQAMGVEGKSQLVTESDMLDGIKFLKQFLLNNPAVLLNYDFFGGKERMNTEISQKELALVASIEERASSTTNSPVLV